jgi:dsRNA-specific ribonuclease
MAGWVARILTAYGAPPPPPQACIAGYLAAVVPSRRMRSNAWEGGGNAILAQLGEPFFATVAARLLIRGSLHLDSVQRAAMLERMLEVDTLAHLARYTSLAEQVATSEDSGVPLPDERQLSQVLLAWVAAIVEDRGYDVAARWIGRVITRHMDLSSVLRDVDPPWMRLKRRVHEAFGKGPRTLSARNEDGERWVQVLCGEAVLGEGRDAETAIALALQGVDFARSVVGDDGTS